MGGASKGYSSKQASNRQGRACPRVIAEQWERHLSEVHRNGGPTAERVVASSTYILYIIPHRGDDACGCCSSSSVRRYLCTEPTHARGIGDYYRMVVVVVLLLLLPPAAAIAVGQKKSQSLVARTCVLGAGRYQVLTWMLGGML